MKIVVRNVIVIFVEVRQVKKMKKEKKMIKKIYTTPKKFAECIDTIFSNNVGQIAKYFGVKADRDNISVDMLMEWLNEKGNNYADFIGFFDSFYEEE